MRSTRSARVPSLAWKVTPFSFSFQASKPVLRSSSQKKRASFRRAERTRLLPAASAWPPSEASTLATTTKWGASRWVRSEEHTSELQSRENLVCRLLLEKEKV